MKNNQTVTSALAVTLMLALITPATLADDPSIPCLADPGLPDADCDGLWDLDELLVHGSDPFNADTDGDGLSDGDEVHIYGTSPVNADTDGDGYDDATDVFPLDPTEWADADGDGIGDNADPDDDNNGIPDHLEFDFRDGTGGWTATGGGVHHNGRYWNLPSRSNSCDAIQSPELDFTGLSSPMVHVDHLIRTVQFDDWGAIRASTDGGATWTYLDATGAMSGPAKQLCGAPADLVAYSGLTWSIHSDVLDASFLAGEPSVILQAMVGIDPGANYDGWRVYSLHVADA